jgi:hypothetical protein
MEAIMTPPAPTADPAQDQRARSPARVWWAGLFAVLAPLLLYNSLFFNRYFPVTEGWFPAYARLIRAGQVPHRDFYLFLPPLYPLQLAAITSVFGDEFIVLRSVGVLVVLSMAGVLYALLTRWFPPFASAFAALLAIVYYQSGVAHIGYDFMQVCTLYSLLGAYCLVRHLDTERAPGAPWWRRYGWAVGAGFWLACAFLTKQSHGTMVAGSVLLATAVVSWPAGWRRSAGNLLALGGGMLAPVSLLAAWLACSGALLPAYEQVFQGAVSAKGDLNQIFFGWARGLFNEAYVARVRAIAAFLLPPLALEALLGWRFSRYLRQDLHGARLNLTILAALLPLTLAALLVPYLWASYNQTMLTTVAPLLRRNQYQLRAALFNYLLPLSVTTTQVLFLGGLLGSLGRRTGAWAGRLAAAAFSFGIMTGCGTCSGLSEVGSFFGLAFLVAWLMSRAADLMLFKVGVGLLGCAYLAFFAGMKYDNPYLWWLIPEPSVRQATRACDMPGLHGMRLSETTVATVTEVVQAIEAHVPKGAPIFCFPHVPQFYLFTDRWPVTAGKVHWFDFLSDDKARADAVRLRQQRPAALVYVDLPDIVWVAHEQAFRHGRPCGQRDILAAIRDWTASGRYAQRVSRDLGYGCTLHVWTLLPAPNPLPAPSGPQGPDDGRKRE